MNPFSPFSPAEDKPQRSNFFNFDDDLETQVLADENQDLSVKEFRTSSIAKQMKDSYFTMYEDDSSVKIGAPLYSEDTSPEKGKVEISESNLSVKFVSSDEKSDSSLIEKVSPSISKKTEIKTSIEHPKDVIRELYLGRHVWIGQFRKLSQKQELLELSLKTYSQNTIFSILLHLRQSLAPETLFETLNQFPKSKIHYFTLLRMKGLDQELITATHACKENETCGRLKMDQARKVSDPYEQALMMKDCIDYLKKFGLTQLAEYASDECELLEAQLSIHAHEKSIGMSQDRIGNIELFTPVLRTPTFTTLYYLCLNHFDSNAGLSCPTNFQGRFNLSNKEFLWIAVSARAQQKDWQAIDTTLKKYQSKSWFGMGKANTFVVPPEKILEIFHEKDPTPWGDRENELRDSLIVALLNLTEDLEDRYLRALDYLCHPIVIETLVKQKDKARLEEYVSKVPAFSKYRKQIGDKLGSKSISWKDV